MMARKLAVRILSVSVAVLIVIVVIYGLYYAGQQAYGFGYRIYMEQPMEEEPGKDVLVKVTKEMDAGQIGTMLKNKGLIRDSALFRAQMLLTSYKKGIVPGTYLLNTSMTAMEMCDMLCTKTEDDKEKPKTAAGKE